MTPRDMRALAREQRKQSLPALVLRKKPPKFVSTVTSSAAPPFTFDFFGLPAELRNMVYDQLWKCTNRVAAYHPQSGLGIIAYYNGIVFDDIISLSREIVDCGHAIEDSYGDKILRGQWRPAHGVGLPIWLLTSKHILEEGISQFRLMAHWNIWPNSRYQTFDCLESIDDMLMSPKYAKSISLSRMASEYMYPWLNYSPSIYGTPTHFDLSEDNTTWLALHGHKLGDGPEIKVLQVALSFQYLPFRQHVDNALDAEPTDVIIDFPYLSLFEACGNLERFELEFFHFDNEGIPFDLKILHTELLEQLRQRLPAAMAGEVLERTTTTPTRIYEGRRSSMQVLDWKLVYTKNES